MLVNFKYERTGGFPEWNYGEGLYDTNEHCDYGFIGQENDNIVWYFGGWSSEAASFRDLIDGTGTPHHDTYSATEIDLASYDGQRGIMDFFTRSKNYIVETQGKLSSYKYNLMVESVLLWAREKNKKFYAGYVGNWVGFGDRGLRIFEMKGTRKLVTRAFERGQQALSVAVDSIWIDAYMHEQYPTASWADSSFEFICYDSINKAIEDEYITDDDIINFANNESWTEIKDTRADWVINIDGVKNPDLVFNWTAPMIEDGLVDGGSATVNMRVYNFGMHEWQNYATFSYNKRLLKVSWQKLAEASSVPDLTKILNNLFDLEAKVHVQMHVTYFPYGSMATTSVAEAWIGYTGFNNGWINPPRDGSTISFTHKTTDDAIDDFLDDIDDIDNPTKTDPSIQQTYSGIGVMTKTYIMTVNRLQQLGRFIWSRDFIDYIQDLNASPIENIVSIKMVPFAVPGGEDEEIVLGNVETGVLGKPVPVDYNCKVTIGTTKINKKYNGKYNYLNSNTFTKLFIFLPYIGFKQLDANTFLDKYIMVEYVNDIITGSCKAIIYAGDSTSKMVPICDYSGMIGLDVPISANNRAQVEMGIISGVGQTVASLASGNVGAAVGSAFNIAANSLHTETKGASSPSCDSFVTHDVFYIIDNAVVQFPSNYGHTHGYPLNLAKTLRNVHGFTVCANVDVTGLQGATVEEMEFIKQKLEEGVYL